MKKVAVIGSPNSQKNYCDALQKAGCDAVIFPDCSFCRKHPDFFDGLLLPGGGDVLSTLSAYSFPPPESEASGQKASSAVRNSSPACLPALDLEQLTALDLFFRMEKPIMGICKGMQLINLYFHGSIGEVSNHTLHQRRGADVFHPAENLPGSFLHALFGPHMIINSNHHQCIQTPGENLQIIERGPDNTAEAIAHLSAPVIGTQWHPERMPSDTHQDATLLFRYFISLL